MKEQQMGMISKHRQSHWEQGLPFFAAAHRFAPSLLSLTRIPSLSVPARAMAGSRRRTFLLQAQPKVQDRTEEGRQQRDHSTSPPTLLSARLAPDGAEGQAGAAKVAIIRPSTKSKPAQSLSRWQHRAFWAIFGHFRRRPSSVCSTATTPALPPAEFQHSHSFLQSTLTPLQLCPPSLEGGHNRSSHHFWQATFLPSLCTSPDASSACLQAPLPEAVKTHAVEAWFTKHPGVKVNWW